MRQSQQPKAGRLGRGHDKADRELGRELRNVLLDCPFGRVKCAERRRVGFTVVFQKPAEIWQAPVEPTLHIGHHLWCRAPDIGRVKVLADESIGAFCCNKIAATTGCVPWNRVETCEIPGYVPQD